ncbi:16S rRNA (guanine(966)-N(2))-methyltransferase RsmD [Hydrogenophaga sp. 5NK40-0174]
MRIIGGQWKRSKLDVPDRPGLRPTPSRVRETLFNWLGQDLSGWRCVDAFAGTGALGLEAASRGSDAVELIEQDPELVRGLRQAVERLKASDRVSVKAGDGLSALKAMPAGSVDLVFLDPPFGGDAGNDAVSLAALAAARHAIHGEGWVYLEAPRAWSEPELADAGYALYRSGKAGQVAFHLLQCTSI